MSTTLEDIFREGMEGTIMEAFPAKDLMKNNNYDLCTDIFKHNNLFRFFKLNNNNVVRSTYIDSTENYTIKPKRSLFKKRHDFVLPSLNIETLSIENLQGFLEHTRIRNENIDDVIKN